MKYECPSAVETMQESMTQRERGERGPCTVPTAERTVCREFEVIVESHRSKIFRFLLASSRDVDVAETLTQECFLKAYRCWSTFRGECAAATWLMRIAINLQRDHWRNRRTQFWRDMGKNRLAFDETCASLPACEKSPEQHVVVREEMRHVWRLVERLTERQRTLFLLRYVEEMDVTEIVQVTGLQKGSVKAHISRALARVRVQLRARQSNREQAAGAATHAPSICLAHSASVSSSRY